MSFPNVPNPYPPGWNDPPKDIFKKSKDQLSKSTDSLGPSEPSVAASSGDVNRTLLGGQLKTILDQCRAHLGDSGVGQIVYMLH
jgi:hypothetical protein